MKDTSEPGSEWIPCQTALPIENETVQVRYRNYKGEVRLRKVRILVMWWGKSKWHTDLQWFLRVEDTEKGGAVRDFALKDCNFINIKSYA